MVNEARFGFNRFTFSQVPSEPISLADIGASRGNAGEFPAAFRVAIGGPGSFSLGTGVNDDRGGAFNTFVYADDFSVMFGKHQIRTGFEADRYQLNRFNRFATRGNVTFANTSAGAGGAGIPSLIGFQNFLLGRATSTQGGAGFFTFHFRALDYSAYAQDDWRIHPRVTLNLGVRLEFLSTAYEEANLLSNFRGNGDDSTGPLHPGTAAMGDGGECSRRATAALDIDDARDSAIRQRVRSCCGPGKGGGPARQHWGRTCGSAPTSRRNRPPLHRGHGRMLGR